MLRAAEARYRLLARLSASAATLAGHDWDRVPLGHLDAWRSELLAANIALLQVSAASSADLYVDQALTEQELPGGQSGSVNPSQFASVAGDGRALVSLFDQPRIAAKTAIGLGTPANVAWQTARDQLRLMSVTAVQDAGRAADAVAGVARRSVTGYIRMLNAPSCSRCTVMAGRFYRWNAGFQRHPRCDCVHIPSREDRGRDLRTDPKAAVLAGQVTGLSVADTRAIVEDGADVGQVINAHRGMSTAQVYGRQLQITNEGVTRYGLAGQRMLASAGRYTRTPRLMPESIYRIAGDDRAEALRLLHRFGYLL